MELKTRYSAGFAIVHKGKVLLCHTTGRGSQSSCGISKGGIEQGESRIEAAIRETREEIGIKVPIKLISTEEHTFVVTSSKYKFNKVVYYYIVEIEDLKQIGLKDLKVPKSQLQLEEIDWAEFVDYKTAMNLVMKSQIPVITTLLSKGLI